MDEEGVLDFLTSLEAMDLPDRIEEVNAKILAKIIEETDYVAVLFCKWSIYYDKLVKTKAYNFISKASFRFFVQAKKAVLLLWFAIIFDIYFFHRLDNSFWLVRFSFSSQDFILLRLYTDNFMNIQI